MKMKNLFVMVIAIFAVAGTVYGQDFIEKITLENGAYAIYKFELPAGATWGNYNKITAEYMVDEENLKKQQRNENNVRLMGNYAERMFSGNRIRSANLGGDGLQNANGPYIMDNKPRTFANMGAAANKWFTVEYDITGASAHAQFEKRNLPAATSTGPFYFGIGIPGHNAGARGGITQFIKNVTLHHSTNPALNVVSKGSGFDAPTYVSFVPIVSRREVVTSAP